MADAEAAEEKPKSGLMVAIIASAVVGFLSGGLGFGAMAFMTAPAEEVTDEPEPPPEYIFIPFGGQVVNINDQKLTRYLRVNLTIQMAAEDNDEAALTELVEKRKPILTDWLLRYLSDMQMEDIRGGVGQNRLKREIQNYFNTVLFPDGMKQIDNLLFEEFSIQ